MRHLRLSTLTLITLIVLLSSMTGLAMPPHPDLIDRIQNGQCDMPYYLAHQEELRQRGIEIPHRIPYLDQMMQRHSLDENFHALAILVDFSDNTSLTPAVSFDSLLYGGSEGSLANYISSITYGNLTFVTVNLPSSLGWRRAPQSYAYYVNGQNGTGSYPHNSQRLAEDAVNLVNPVVDFSQYDNDGDGQVDALFIIHAGPGAEYTGSLNQIWSHQWSMVPGVSLDGVTARDYSVEPEYWFVPGDMTCGVYAHELGHAAFGLPDFYDYGYDSYGLGKWSLMAYGSWNGRLGSMPAHPDAWSKISMGVVTPILVTTALTGVSIPAVETSPTIYKINHNGNPGSQYVLVENRQQTGYDVNLPGSGLLIYHVDDNVFGNNEQWYPGHTTSGHYQVALEQADGLWQMEHNSSSGNSGDPYGGTSGNVTYDDTSTPNSKGYTGLASDISIRNVSTSAAVMTADLNGTLIRRITVVSPNGGETWYGGDIDTIRWTSSNVTGSVSLEINRAYPGGAWTSIVASTANTGWYRWVLPAGVASAARIRIRSLSFATIGDSSNANFTIGQRSISVTSPNTNATWLTGDARDITWTSQNLNENVKIEINRAYPTGTWSVIAASVPNTGLYNWIMAGSASAGARIRVSGTIHTSISGVSPINFPIGIRGITVTAPNSAATWIVGDTNPITWTSTNMPEEAVSIELNRNYPSASWVSLASSVANTGSYLWTITSPLTTTARIRIRGTIHPTVGDTSNVNFAIGQRSISVTKPNTAITCFAPGIDSIRWTSVNLSENVKIELNRNYPSGTWEVLAASVSNLGSYRWNVSGVPTSTARVRVSGVTHTTVSDVSDVNFSIVQGDISLTWMSGSSPLYIGDRLNLQVHSNLAENSRLEINRTYPNGGWTAIASNVANDSILNWLISGPVSESVRIRAIGVSHNLIGDTTALFAIRARTLTVTSPNTAVTWAIGDVNPITWTSTNLPENVKIELKRTYATGSWETIAASVANNGTYSWLTTGPLSTASRIRITGVTHTSSGDTSNVNFSIKTRSLTVSSPNTATTMLIGGIDTIKWTSVCMPENVLIQINRNYPSASWTTIAASTANTGTYPWLVSGPITATARIRISGLVHTTIVDTSNANFAVAVPSLALTSPVGGESWVVGDIDSIRWTSVNLTENVKIELNRNFPTGGWTTLISSTANTGLYRWTVTTGNSTSARIRISAVSHTFVRDSSDANFSIGARTITITSPMSVVSWAIGSSNNITWTSQNMTENVKIEINRSYPSGPWSVLAASVANTGSYAWTVTGPATTTARVRITGVTHTTITRTSTPNFTIRVAGSPALPLGISQQQTAMPEEFFLSQNYPNPFNPSTTIEFGLPQRDNIRLEIFNLLGNKVASLYEGSLEAGVYHMTWNATDNASGVYIVRLQSEQRSFLRRMVLMK